MNRDYFLDPATNAGSDGIDCAEDPYDFFEDPNDEIAFYDHNDLPCNEEGHLVEIEGLTAYAGFIFCSAPGCPESCDLRTPFELAACAEELLSKGKNDHFLVFSGCQAHLDDTMGKKIIFISRHEFTR